MLRRCRLRNLRLRRLTLLLRLLLLLLRRLLLLFLLLIRLIFLRRILLLFLCRRFLRRIRLRRRLCINIRRSLNKYLLPLLILPNFLRRLNPNLLRRRLLLLSRYFLIRLRPRPLFLEGILNRPRRIVTFL